MARLPEEAWCQQAAGSPVERWSVDRELLAQIADHLTVLASDRRYSEPVRIPRPQLDKATDKPPEKKAATAAEVAAFFRSRRVSAGR